MQVFKMSQETPSLVKIEVSSVPNCQRCKLWSRKRTQGVKPSSLTSNPDAEREQKNGQCCY